MKIVAISDCHGDYTSLKEIANRENDADIYILLGDSELPEYMISPFVSVKGNCDHFEDYPKQRIIKTPYGNILCEHGHSRTSITVEDVKDSGCFIYLYGHTHRHMVKEIDGVYFANPGSTSRPRDDTNGTYLIINLDKNDVSFEFKYL